VVDPSGLAAKWLTTKDKTFDKEQFQVIDNARVPLGHRRARSMPKSKLMPGYNGYPTCFFPGTL